jgi:hypothetical protein
MVTQRCVGVARRIGRVSRKSVGVSHSACEAGSSRMPAWRRAGLAWSPPAMPPRCARPRRRHPDRPLPLPTARRLRRLHQPRPPRPLPRGAGPRPAAAGRRGHGFPRSHGPTEHKVNAPWLTFRCQVDPNRAALRGSVAARTQRMRSKHRRNPRPAEILAKPWPLPSRRARAGDAGSGLEPREATPSKQPKEPKSRRKPRQNPSRPPACMCLLATREHP